MKLGIIRGNFNPPNYGHIFSAIYAAKTHDLDSLFICPIYKNADKQLASWDHRISMLRIAFQGINICKIETTDETNKSGTCLDFLKNIKQTLPKANIIMFSGIGAEMDKDNVKNEEEILKICSIVPIMETGSDKYEIPHYSDKRIMKLIFKEKWDALAQMVPVHIIKLIQSHNLYQDQEDTVVPTAKKK